MQMSHTEVVVSSMRDRIASEMPQRAKPKVARIRGWVRSTILPTRAARSIVMTAIGALMSAACVGV